MKFHTQPMINTTVEGDSVGILLHCFVQEN